MERYGHFEIIRRWVSDGNLHVTVVDLLTREVSHIVKPMGDVL